MEYHAAGDTNMLCPSPASWEPQAPPNLSPPLRPKGGTGKCSYCTVLADKIRCSMYPWRQAVAAGAGRRVMDGTDLNEALETVILKEVQAAYQSEVMSAGPVNKKHGKKYAKVQRWMIDSIAICDEEMKEVPTHPANLGKAIAKYARKSKKKLNGPVFADNRYTAFRYTASVMVQIACTCRVPP